MRTKLISKSEDRNQGYGAGSGTTERYEFECPCGNGMIVEEHDNIPGFREHNIFIECPDCSKVYDLDTSKGVHSWELIERHK